MNNTIILPVDDVALCEQLLKEQLHQKAEITMIILGGSELSSKVQMADNLASEAYFNIRRRVVWLREPSLLQSQLDGYLKKFQGYSQDAYQKVRAFTMTPVNDKVADIIYDNEPLDYVRLNMAFFKAGQQ